MPTVDEDLDQIEHDIRILKIEYEQFFGGGRKRPPIDTQWRLDSLVKRYGERLAEISLQQRFRFNNLLSTYAKYQDMWRKRVVRKELGTVDRHFGAAAKAIAAQRARDMAEARRALAHTEAATAGLHGGRRSHDDDEIPAAAASPAFSVQFSGNNKETRKVHDLYGALIDTRMATGDKSGAPSLEEFERFVEKKTDELRRRGGKEIEYTVTIEGGKVKLKARVSR
ncbi:MAG TPA: MXAN_5187 C-terminal domain-containing protein [Candidatus Acidoferrales bacterium]|nr:MXAN_5187 C-terminal domain-containing protein [Candidatus Acidoferrales bacterium]